VTAVDLGGILLESDAEVALAPDGVRADALGTIEALEQGLAALRARHTDSANATAAMAALAELRSAVERPLAARGQLVVKTGVLGASLRLLAREGGFRIKPPYAPRVPTNADPIAEPVSRLTVPAARAPVDAARAALGARLFSDRRLSGARRQSCATCHVPSRAFSDGLKRPRSLDAEVTLRHTPTLLYAPAQAAQLWDGRVITRQRQALRVLHSTAEMGVTDEQIVQRVSEDAPLRANVERVFPNGVTAENVVAALADYQESALVPARAPIDELSRGTDTLSAAASSGLDVFAGPARCARCHVPPLFGGTRPNDFAITVYAAIGTTTDPTGKKLDEDRGRFAVTALAADDHVFKTPTLRNVARTAPYVHNGAFPTLESVVDFYDKGGGRAFGHRVDNQDPDVRPLHLTRQQRRDLLIFLREALTDRRDKP
jgi:cytochrome c peroxidase